MDYWHCKNLRIIQLRLLGCQWSLTMTKHYFPHQEEEEEEEDNNDDEEHREDE